MAARLTRSIANFPVRVGGITLFHAFGDLQWPWVDWA